jgi:hypothetical protein
MTRVLTAAALTLALGAPVAVALARPAPELGLYLVVAAPWDDAADVAVRAGARLTGPVQPRVGALVADDRPDARARLGRAGAWLVMSNPDLLRLCGVRA